MAEVDDKENQNYLKDKKRNWKINNMIKNRKQTNVKK